MKKVAVIGSGISGIIAAYFLKDFYQVTLFESGSYFGGHSNTITVKVDDKLVPVDTGFIVFNKLTYPNFLPFLKHLNVPIEKSDMSFGVSLFGGNLEYCSSSFSRFFAQKKNLLNKDFWRMGLDILKFNKRSSSLCLKTLAEITLEDYINQIGLSDAFKKYYLYPMAGAIWSAPAEQIGSFPASTFLQFFKNHGLLTVTDHPQWYTVSGGSVEYVKRALESARINKIKDCPIQSVKRTKDGISIKTKQDEQKFDIAILATPANISHRILQGKSYSEDKVLGSFGYTRNIVYLHSDRQFMPRNEKAWASWNYFTTQNKSVGVTYWMNLLQKLPSHKNIFVTLNPETPPAADLTYKKIFYHHPFFDQKAIEAQKEISSLQGEGGVYFCGSYQRYGFHEDGVFSALKVVNELGVLAPWQ